MHPYMALQGMPTLQSLPRIPHRVSSKTPSPSPTLGSDLSTEGLDVVLEGTVSAL